MDWLQSQRDDIEIFKTVITNFTIDNSIVIILVPFYPLA